MSRGDDSISDHPISGSHPNSLLEITPTGREQSSETGKIKIFSSRWHFSRDESRMWPKKIKMLKS